MKIDEAYAKLSIIQDLVPTGNINRPGNRLHASSITIHNTDNTSKGANAAAHAKYMKGADAQKRKVSWHFTVDDKFVYQSIPTNEITWHSGTREGNNTSVSIEICMNSDLNEKAAYERAALLTAVIAYRLGIQIPSSIFQHHDWSGKDCPKIIRHKKDGWKDFLKSVTDFWKDLAPVEAMDIALTDDGREHHHA